MMVHGIYWDPKCMPCYYPWECLLFIECALGPLLAFVAGMYGAFTPMSRARKAVSLFFAILAPCNQTAAILLVIWAHDRSFPNLTLLETVCHACA